MAHSGSKQYKWLKNDLGENGNRPTVVTFHPSPFSSGPHARKNKKGEFAEKPIALTHRHLMPLFEKHSVRVVFSGHDHHYERSKKAGIYYIVQGMGGAPLRGAKTENPHSQKIVTKMFGYSLVRVRQDDMDILTRNPDGKVIDRISVSLQ